MVRSGRTSESMCQRVRWCAWVLNIVYLDEVLPFRLCDERLELGCGEGVDKSRLGDDKQEHLSASEDGQFVCL
jgi:hypothetical protein